MPIAHGAANGHEFSTSVSNLSFTTDSGTAVGDVFVVAVAARGNATITLPSGSVDTHFKDLPLAGDRLISVFTWKASAAGTQTINIPLSTATTGSVTWERVRDSDGEMSGVIDSDSVTPLGFQTGVVVPAVTTSVENAFICGGVFVASGSNTPSVPGSGWTQRALTAVVRNLMATKGLQASAGSSGTATFSIAAEADRIGWQLALLPAAATPPVEAREVMATAQTEYMPSGFSGDIADTPAIWVDPDNGARSVILGSRKASTGGGIDVYGLDGARLSFYSVGEINNVDLRDLRGVSGWDDRILAVGTNRTNNTLAYAWLDRTTRTLSSAGSTAVGFEPYGLTLYQSPVDGFVYAFVTESTGGANGVKQFRLTRSGSTVSGTQVRSWTTESLAEGMTCHDAESWLFLGVEDVGLFRYGAEPDAGTTRVTIDEVGDGRLFADVEGIRIAYGRGEDPSYLVVSSQGNNTFAIYELDDPHEWVESVTVVGDGGAIGDTTETDGLAVTRADLSPWWPDGVLVVHDTENAAQSQPASNFKLVDAGRVFPDLSYRAAPVTVTGTSTASLTTPATRWTKAPMAPVWFDTVAGTWRAILPTSTGHRFYTLDPGGNTQGAVVDDRQGARITAVHHAGITYVLCAGTGTNGGILKVYDSTLTQVGSSATLTLTGVTDLDASPVTLRRMSNGHLWIAWKNTSGTNIQVRRSTDDGATIATSGDNVGSITVPWSGTSAIVDLAQAGSTVVLIASANDGVGRVARTIPLSSAALSATNWTSEATPSFPSGITSDDHLSSVALPDGRVLAVAKTTGATTTAHPLLQALVRDTGGTWAAHTIEAGPDTTPRFTRPKVTLAPSGELVAVYGSIEGARDLSVRTMSLDAFGTWSGRSAKLLGPNWSDSAVLPTPASLAAAGARPWPILAHARDAQTIQVQWQVRESSGQIPGRVGTATIEGMYLGSAPVAAIYLGDLQLV